MGWGRVSQTRVWAVAGEGKFFGGGWMGPAVKTFLILGKKEEGFMPTRSLLRPGEEERKTEIETEQEGEGWIWADGGRQQGQRHQRITGLHHPAAQPRLSVSVITTPGYRGLPTHQPWCSQTLPEA